MNRSKEWMHVPPSTSDGARDALLPGRGHLIAGICGEVTPHRPLSREVRWWMKELKTADRRKDEFLAMVSHELRTPLASIRYGLRVLGKLTGESDDRQRMHALIERQLQRITRLVDELTDVSRITSGRLHLHLEQLDLRIAVRNAIETLEPEIAGRNHRLAVLLPDEPVWLQADASRLEQVFMNLLANAVKYTDPGGELAVSMHASGRQAVVRVRDSGIGIAQDVLPRIFDLFKQANEADTRSQSGLGVGLAVVRNLVTLHRGVVTAVSRGFGQGSEFIVRLPMAG